MNRGHGVHVDRMATLGLYLEALHAGPQFLLLQLAVRRHLDECALWHDQSWLDKPYARGFRGFPGVAQHLLYRYARKALSHGREHVILVRQLTDQPNAVPPVPFSDAGIESALEIYTAAVDDLLYGGP